VFKAPERIGVFGIDQEYFLVDKHD
jgi:hypothetical protein